MQDLIEVFRVSKKNLAYPLSLLQLEIQLPNGIQ